MAHQKINVKGIEISIVSLKNEDFISLTDMLRATAGRYGGTYAHKDIAFEFGMWISPEFKIYLIKEFQRLKLEENEKMALGWDVKRLLAKANYKVHTDAVKERLIPSAILKKQADFIYADEADVLNVALFEETAKEWRIQNHALSRPKQRAPSHE